MSAKKHCHRETHINAIAMKKIWKFIIAHKIISVLVLGGLGWGGYAWYAASHGTTVVARYVIEKATTGTVIASVSGSGQMQAVNTIDIKPQTSGAVISIPVKVGDHVKAGRLLVQLDTTTEARALAQAKLQLLSAQLSLAKLTEAPAMTTLIQNQNAVVQAQSNIATASTTLAKDYQAGFTTLTGVFVDFQTIMTSLQSFVTGGDIVKGQGDPDAYLNLVPSYMQAGLQPYRDTVYATYNAVAALYQQNLTDYQGISRSASSVSLDVMFVETNHTAQAVSEAVKAAKNFLSYLVNNYPTGSGYTSLPSVTATWQTNMNTHTTTIGNDLTNLTGAINTIASDRATIVNNQLALSQASSALAQLLAGPDSIDVQTSQLSVRQQELSVQTAEQNLANDSIRAPVDGVISAIPAVVGATVPSPAVSMIGQNQIAEITLNEVDAAKVKVGNKATLTFSAVSGLSLVGQVIELDPVGTVSQGVVSYNAKIALATPNDQIRPGMSVSANIITRIDQDVIAVPNMAIITQGGVKYVLKPLMPVSDADIAASVNGGIVLPAAPIRMPVTIGLSNNTETEIVSGVNQGDQIIAQTINAAASGGSSVGMSGGTNAFRALGGGGFGGGRGAGQ